MEPAQDEQDEADDAQEFASAAEACSVQDELMEVDEDAGQAAMIMCGCANFWGCWARSTDAYEATERGAMPSASVDPRSFTSARPHSLFHLPHPMQMSRCNLVAKLGRKSLAGNPGRDSSRPAVRGVKHASDYLLVAITRRN